MLEPLHAAGGVYHTVFAGEEGVTLAAKLHLERLLGRAYGKGITTGAGYLGVGVVFGMDFIFHLILVSVNADLSLGFC